MVYYPLSVLMMAGLRDVLVITTPHEQEGFKRLLGDGAWLGMNIQYAVQEKPNGISQAFVIGKEFIDGDSCALVLGDNIFFGDRLPERLRESAGREKGATVFGYMVKDPERYGVVSFDSAGQAQTLEEKPEKPKSNFAVTGLYFYDERVVEFAESLTPSSRGEYEITDLNRKYLELGELHVERLGRGYAWLDTGTHESLLSASNFIYTIEERQGLKVACVEEIAFREGYIDADAVKKLADPMAKTGYGQYLLRMLEE